MSPPHCQEVIHAYRGQVRAALNMSPQYSECWGFSFSLVVSLRNLNQAARQQRSKGVRRILESPSKTLCTNRCVAHLGRSRKTARAGGGRVL